ncbi:MAG: hypothetical protein GXO75_15405 [Calditrichaeota bacterium]|nr:hypothetical protein [Calditrichota bacterium]
MASELKVIIRAIDRTKQAVRSAETGFQKLSNKVKNISFGQIAMLGGVAYAANRLINIYGAQERAVARLESAMKNVRTAGAGATKMLIEQARALQKVTTFGDEQIISAQAMLATFQLNEKQIAEITPRLLDMAAATEKTTGRTADLEQIAIALGKAFTGQPGLLSRYGVVLDKTAVKTQGFSGIIKSLDDNFKGMAQTIGQTGTGQMRQVKNVMGDLSEVFGKFLVKNVLPLAVALSDLAQKFMELPGPIQNATIAVVSLGGALRVLGVSAGAITGPLGLIAMTAAGIASALSSIADETQQMLDQAYRAQQIAPAEQGWKKAVEDYRRRMGVVKDYYQKKQEIEIQYADFSEELEQEATDRMFDMYMKDLLGRTQLGIKFYLADKEIRLKVEDDVLKYKRDKWRSFENYFFWLTRRMNNNLKYAVRDAADIGIELAQKITAEWQRFAWNAGSAISNGIGQVAIGGLERWFDRVFARARGGFARLTASIIESFSQMLIRMEMEMLASKVYQFLAGSGGFLTAGGILGFGLAAIGAFFQHGGTVQPIPTVPIYAQSGVNLPVRGTDSVPAMLTPGERVITRETTQRLGDEFFDRLEAGLSAGQTTVNVNLSISTVDAAGLREFVRSGEFRRELIEAINDGVVKLQAGGAIVEGRL